MLRFVRRVGVACALVQAGAWCVVPGTLAALSNPLGRVAKLTPLSHRVHTHPFLLYSVGPNPQLVYYYDSTIGASRYDHDQGQEFVTCVGVAGQADGAACTVVNSNDGNMYINFPDTE